jgi:hypothetical protein
MAKQRGIPAFLMTGSIEHMPQLGDSGQLHLAKPFRPRDFLAQIHERIGSADESPPQIG